MHTVIALFRGINVGGKQLLPMAELIPLLEELGLQQVQSYIQSGNLLFRTEQQPDEQLAAQISNAVNSRFGFSPLVLLMSPAELQASLDNSPFRNTETKSQHFYFLHSPAEAPNLERLQALKSDSESFELEDRLFYLFAPDGIGRSKLAAQIEKSLGVPTTARNRNTVSKILAMLDA